MWTLREAEKIGLIYTTPTDYIQSNGVFAIATNQLLHAKLITKCDYKGLIDHCNRCKSLSQILHTSGRDFFFFLVHGRDVEGNVLMKFI